MNKKFTYLFIIALFIAAVSFIVINYQAKRDGNKVLFYSLQERKGTLASAPEWAATRTKASDFFKAVRDNPKDKQAALGLAALFIQEARVTGNYQYYDVAAMKQVDHVLAMEPENFEALTLKALINLSQHHFTEALEVAQKAKKLNPYNAFIHGILVDAHVELGNYTEAVAAADKMISIRPDLRSYSRISYLREIHGDYMGAIQAMQMAVDAGVPGEEGTEWARVQLGQLHETNGDLQNANNHYTAALNYRPGYAYALAGLGRIEKSKKNYPAALKNYEQADTLVRDYTFKEALIDLYALSGEKKKADQLSASLIKEMAETAEAAATNEELGHYSDGELAAVYLKAGKLDKALEHALAEYNRRPDNIDVNKTVASVYYSRGDYKAALPYLQTALKTGSKNPDLLCYAGLIYIKNGEVEKGKSFLAEALHKNKTIAEALKKESQQVLQSM